MEKRHLLPDLADKLGYSLLTRYVQSHSHKKSSSRRGSSSHSRSSSSSPRWRHSSTIVWPLGTASMIGAMLSGVTGDGADELGEALGLASGRAVTDHASVAKVSLGWTALPRSCLRCAGCSLSRGKGCRMLRTCSRISPPPQSPKMVYALPRSSCLVFPTAFHCHQRLSTV